MTGAAGEEAGEAHESAGAEGLIRSTVDQLRADPRVLGVLLVGSWARGDALRGSDVDLEVLVRERPPVPFELRTGEPPGGEGAEPQRREAIPPTVEIAYLDPETWRERLRGNAMSLYSFLDGRVLFERDGALSELSHLARERWRAFRWPEEKVAATRQWLESACVKVRAAQEEGDRLRAALILSTTHWAILEALWMVNGLPMPPVGGVMAHLDDLKVTPAEFRTDVRVLLLGEHYERLVAGLRIMDWTIEELEAVGGRRGARR